MLQYNLLKIQLKYNAARCGGTDLKMENNEKLSYKLIACDLDGTLLQDDMTLSEENVAAIKTLTESGIVFAPCTGRTYGEIPEAVRENGCIRYFIYSDGAAILDKATGEISDAYIPKELACKIFDMLCEYDTEILIHAGGNSHVDAASFDTARYAEHYHMNENYRTLISEANIKVESFSDFGHNAESVELFCCFFANDCELEACRARLVEIGELIVTSSAPHNLEIAYKTAGKGNALIRLAKMLGIKRADTVGIGDSPNDLSLLENAGLALAVEGAAESLKESADAVICPNSEHVAAYLVDAFLSDDGENAEILNTGDLEAENEKPVISYKKLAIASALIAAAIGILIILAVVIDFFGGSYKRVGYIGSQTWTAWSGTYVLLDGEMSHTLRCETGTLHISVETEEGKIGIEITDSNGNTVFDKDNIGTTNFTVAAEGKVYVKITAEDHKGNFVISD